MWNLGIKSFFEIGEGLYELPLAFDDKISQATRFANADSEKSAIGGRTRIAYKESARECVNLALISKSHNPKGIDRMCVEIAKIGVLLYELLHDIVVCIAL